MNISYRMQPKAHRSLQTLVSAPLRTSGAQYTGEPARATSYDKSYKHTVKKHKVTSYKIWIILDSWLMESNEPSWPLILFLMFCGEIIFSLLSPTPISSAITREKNSSRLSPWALARQKLEYFRVPGPSNKICEHTGPLARFEKKKHKKDTLAYKLNLILSCDLVFV